MGEFMVSKFLLSTICNLWALFFSFAGYSVASIILYYINFGYFIDCFTNDSCTRSCDGTCVL